MNLARARKRLFIIFLLIILILNYLPQSSASLKAEILPHPVYTVYMNQTYTLTVNVEYNIPLNIVKEIGPIELWVSSPRNESDKAQLKGNGIYPFEIQLVAPYKQGDQAIEVILNLNSRQHGDSIIDKKIFHYKVTKPIFNDWAITKVWIMPESPMPGKELTFYAIVTLKNTTSEDLVQQGCAVGFFLKDKILGGVSLRFDPSLLTSSTRARQVHQKWVAEKGFHQLSVVVADSDNFPDPFPKDNERSIIFLVGEEPKYVLYQYFEKVFQDRLFFIFYGSLIIILIILLVKLQFS